MRQIPVYLFILFTFTFLACDNEEFIPTELLNSYVGIWEIERVSGGFTGQGLSMGFNKIVLNEDGSFVLFNENTIVEKGTYLTYQNVNIQDVIQLNSVGTQLNEFTEPEKVISLQKDGTLTMFDTCCVYFSYFFERSK